MECGVWKEKAGQTKEYDATAQYVDKVDATTYSMTVDIYATCTSEDVPSSFHINHSLLTLTVAKLFVE